MLTLPVQKTDPETRGESHGCGTTCGTSCGAGLEKVYPTTAVRYGAMSWIGEFSYKPGTVFKCGAKVVIETDRGIEVGQQVSVSCNGCGKQVSREQIQQYVRNSGPEFYRLRSGRILREATPQDISEHDRLNATASDDIDQCALLAAQMGLDVKIVSVEHLLGGERIVFYFRSADDERVDFRELVRELASLHRTRIEMRQVKPRDEARLVADYEICGRECCCKNFLKKLRPVNMKMAKLQKSTLDPSKISGRCGLLRCCLRYEHETYEQLAAKLPPIGSRVQTAAGPADVVDRQILTQLLLVRTADDRLLAIPVEEIESVTLRKDLAPEDRELVRRPPEPEARPAGPERRGAPPARERRPPPEEFRRTPPRPSERPPPREERLGEAPPPHESDAAPDDAGQPAAEGGPRRGRRRRRRRGRRPGGDARGGEPRAPDDPGGPTNGPPK